ncbi:MAG: right-handed parallel beta-helix repeat-containing protein [Verrucomicrobiota bacterium]
MKKLTAVWLMAMAMIAAGHAATFFVAPNGDDANPGSLAKPFASPAYARDAIRAAKLHGDKGPFAVELRGGVYALNETILLTPEDSGTAEAPVIWRAHAQENAVISGGRVIGGFRESTENGLRRWSVELPNFKNGTQPFRQLFVSTTEQAFERRYRPMLGMKRVDAVTESPRREGARHRAAQRDFYFAPGDFQAWENLSDVEVVVLHVWSSSRLRVQQVDTRKNIVTFTGRPTFAVDQDGLQPYFIENVKEELKSPGQWYLDRPSGVLTYLPCAGETLTNTRIVAPRLVNVMVCQSAAHIEFHGLTFSHNEAPLPHDGYGGSQGQADLPAAIELNGARNCALVRCEVSRVGSYGIGMGAGSHSNRVIGCRLFDLGGGGVKIGDLRMTASADYPVLPTGNRIENCAISDGGLMYFSANAIWGGFSRGTVLRHNQIWNFPYSGIALGWSWNDTPTGCASNRIEYNSISNVIALLADGASIYTLGRQPGTVIRGNVVRDTVRSPFAKHDWQLGLYLDEGSAGMLVENNFVFNVGTHGFNSNGGAQNVVRNNIFGPVHGKLEPFIRFHKKSYTRANVFTRNLCYLDSTNLTDAAWDKTLCDCRSNLYWNCAGLPLLFQTNSFTEWQAGGQDAGSLNADPLFEDPAHGDFRLKKSSPAFALGFEPFDYTVAGLEPEFRGVAAAVKIAAPPCYAMKLPGPRPFTGFAIEFDDVAVSRLPRGFTCNGGRPEATFQVADGIGKNGHHALAATTTRKAAKPFYPYVTYRIPENLDHGTVRFACDVRQKADAPAFLDIGFRDYSKRGNPSKEFTSLPGVTFALDGTIKSASGVLAKAALGTWTHVEISFPLTGDNRTASIAVTMADGSRKQVSAPMAAAFKALSSLGFFCNDSADGACYFDNLKLEYKP